MPEPGGARAWRALVAAVASLVLGAPVLAGRPLCHPAIAAADGAATTVRRHVVRWRARLWRTDSGRLPHDPQLSLTRKGDLLQIALRVTPKVLVCLSLSQPPGPK
jgi:hypothetical protein